MTITCSLNEKRCIPCEGDIPPLDKKEIDKLLSELQNRPLRKFAYREEFEGDTEHRTAAYIDVREDSSTGSTPKLPLEVEFPKRANDWIVNELGHLYKQYKFPDFVGAMEFANKIAEIAEQEAHHPDLTISWGTCSIEIWTHKINGLTESDFILAAKIEDVLV